jgi:flavodoxin I
LRSSAALNSTGRLDVREAKVGAARAGVISELTVTSKPHLFGQQLRASYAKLEIFLCAIFGMKKVLVLYYSRSGNTEKMAKAVMEGAQGVNDTVVDLTYHLDGASELAGYDAILVGAPTYRKEMPIDFKNLFQEAAEKGINLKGKIGAAFGSYGWDGTAPAQVVELMQALGMVVSELPLLAKYIPDKAVLDACIDLGRRIAETLKNQP